LIDGAPSPFRFSTRLRVRFAETDAQGVVYHSNFLIYCEVGRVEYARVVFGAPGIKVSRTWEPTVVHAELDFKQPARFDDEIDVRLRTARLGTTS
jgi:acyl-CoA thioester hydrolase